MTKGKPWPAFDELRLRDWFTSGITDLRVLAFSLGEKYSEDAVRQKLIRIGLLREEVQQCSANCCTTSKLQLPEELPSVEETLKTLSAALAALNTPGLSKSEVLRLRGIIGGAKIYQELLVDYISYRSIEAELLDLREKFAELAKKTQ